MKHTDHYGWHISTFFAWYDCWVGAYWDRGERSLYLALVPMLVLKIRLPRRPTDYAYDDPRKCHWGHQLAEHATFRYRICGDTGWICTRCGVVNDEPMPESGIVAARAKR